MPGPSAATPSYAFYRLATIGWANPLLKSTVDLLDGAPRDEVCVDLSRLTFVDAFGVTYLAACLHRSLRSCGRVWVKPPLDPKVRQYLQDVGCFQAIGLGEHFQARQPRADRVDLVHLRALEPGFIDHLLDFLEYAQPFGEAVRLSVRMSLMELLQNFVEHSKSEHGAWAAGQFHPRPKGSEIPRINLCFLDVGMGIPNALRTVAKYSRLGDEPLVELSVEDGVSSQGETRGRGLTMIHRFVRANGGRMTILSRRGKARFPPDRRPIPEKLEIDYPGSAIFLSLSPTARGLYEI